MTLKMNILIKLVTVKSPSNYWQPSYCKSHNLALEQKYLDVLKC